MFNVMNQIFLSGKVYDIVKKEVGNNIVYNFVFVVYQILRGKRGSVYLKFPCELWNNKIGERLKDGDLVLLSGAVKEYIREKDNIRSYKKSIKVDKLYFIQEKEEEICNQDLQNQQQE